MAITEKEWLGRDNKIGIDIWNKKYRQNGESFEQWLNRVSGGDDEIRQLILDKKFIFGGRILSNRGLGEYDKKVSLSNCYVLDPPEDNIESIFECAKKLARTFSYGGGCGIDIGKLRPRDSYVHNAAERSTGAVSFMDMYSHVTETISQNGRRGALMISIPCDHPDIEEFIDLKTDLNKVTKANISIRITNDFMEAVKNDSTYKLRFKIDYTGEDIQKEVRAKDIFMKICMANYDYAEPGMLFWDTIENSHLLSNRKDFKYAGVNPCGEEPLPAGGACLLGSLNLSEFVSNPFTNEAAFDLPLFEKAVRDAVQGLNIVLDEGILLHPLQIQRDSASDWRQIGLGMFGLADMLIKLGVKYGSEESLTLCDRISKTMLQTAIAESADLAEEYGAFPMCSNEDLCQNEMLVENVTKDTLEQIKHTGLRNSQLLTIAPTGTISTMFGVSGGIEPIFENYYTRKTESLHGEDVCYKIFTPIVKEYLSQNNTDQDVSELPDYFVTASMIHSKDRIKMQSVWQKHIDASISSTVNLPEDTTVEEIETLYMYAWEHGLKGLTIYRAGCKREGILTTEIKDDKKQKLIVNAPDSQVELKRGDILDVMEDLVGYKRKLITGCGSLHFETYCDESNGYPLETFINIGSSGGCERNYQFISRLMSGCLRAGVPVEFIFDQSQSIRPCSTYLLRAKTVGDTSKGTSCPSAIGWALKDLYEKAQDMVFVDDAEIDQYFEEQVGMAYDIDNRDDVDYSCSSNCESCEGDKFRGFNILAIKNQKLLDEFNAIPPVQVIPTSEMKQALLTADIETDLTYDEYIQAGMCPECHQVTNFEGGCVICKSCGWSRCD